MLPTKKIDRLADFVRLPLKVREKVTLRLEIVEDLDRAENKSVRAREWASELSHMRGFSKKSILTHYYGFVNSGRDWRVLINKSELRKAVGGAPDIDVAKIIKTYAERNQRSSKAAYRAMLRDLQAGKVLPGDVTWRDLWRQDYPHRQVPLHCPSSYVPKGWTYGNLQRRFGLTAYEAVATRRGRGAARDHLPPVYTTRVGLAVGQMYQFDDMWHDAEVNFLGVNKKAMRPLELACIDVYSGCKFAYGLKAMTERDDGTRKTLTELEMRYLLANVLCNIGYNEQTGCTLIVEHGTAAIRDDMRKLLRNWSGGKLDFADSGILKKQLHSGLFMGRPRGNFKVKAIVESSHSLAHNEAAAIEGQMGRNRDNSPEELHGRDHYNVQMLKAYERLALSDPERAKLLLFPFANFYAYRNAIYSLYDIINERTDHELEGFVEAGLVRSEFRLIESQQEWLPMEELMHYDPVQQQAIQAVISRPGMSRTRKLSPQEVWDQGKDKLTTLPKYYIPEILGPRPALTKRVDTDGLIRFECADIGPGEHRYYATVITPQGYQQSLAVGQQYMLHVNPLDISEVFVTDPDSGAMLGIAHRWGEPSKADLDAIHAQMGKQSHHEKLLADPIRERHTEESDDRLAMIEHNKAVMAGEVRSPEQIIRDAALPEINDYDDLTANNEEPEEAVSLEEIAGYLKD